MGVYLAFDLGASSGRAIVGVLKDGVLNMTEVHRFPNGPIEQKGSYFWDYLRLCEELKIGLKKALDFNPNIECLGVDTWGVDYVFFDRETKQPLRLPYNYRDHRTDDPQPVFDKISQDDLYAATGIQHMTINTLFQLFAHKRDFPEDFEKGVFLPIPDALAFSLGADFTAEYTHASTTELLDPNTKQWQSGIIKKLGLPMEIFPQIVAPCANGGTISAELQKQLRCKPIRIVKIGSHDTASAVASVPAPEQGNWMYISAGTWALLGAEIAKPFISKESQTAKFTNEGGLNNTIRFLTNIIGSWLFQETKRNWKEQGRDISFGEMEEMAKKAEALKFIINPNDPRFASPCDMPQMIREYCQQTGQGIPNDNELVRAIYDSLALLFATKVKELEKLLNVKYNAINIVGGGTQAKLLMQLTADAANTAVIAGPIEATATGNLLTQAIANGEVKDLNEARKIVKNSSDVLTYTPNPVSVAEFARKSVKYKF